MLVAAYALTELFQQLVDRSVACEVNRELMALRDSDLSTFLRIAMIVQDMPVHCSQCSRYRPQSTEYRATVGHSSLPVVVTDNLPALLRYRNRQ